MHVPTIIRTTFGPSFIPTRTTVRVTLTRGELFAAIRQIECDAADAGAEAWRDIADRLDWRAADLREAAR